MSDIVNKNENLELELDDNTILSNLFGINDRNLSLIEQINQVKIQYRGNKIKISGNKKSIFETKKTILNLFKEAQNGAEIDEDRIRDKFLSLIPNKLLNIVLSSNSNSKFSFLFTISDIQEQN